MNLWSRIKNLRAKQLFKLIVVFGKNPRYVFPSMRATRRTLAICNEHFGKKHHKNNRANAFRHALWNILLCREIFKIETNVENTSNWAKTITDLHEEFAFSTELAKAMDLHNNAVGRKVFKEKYTEFALENEIISTLKELAGNAQQIKLPEEVENFSDNLVFMEEKSN